MHDLIVMLSTNLEKFANVFGGHLMVLKAQEWGTFPKWRAGWNSTTTASSEAPSFGNAPTTLTIKSGNLASTHLLAS